MKRLWAVAAVLALSCGGTRVPGEHCKNHGDCGSLPQGYCSRAEICTRECDEEQPCPDGSSCVWGGGRRVCLPQCAQDDECLPGFACDVASEAPVCRLVNPLAPPAD